MRTEVISQKTTDCVFFATILSSIIHRDMDTPLVDYHVTVQIQGEVKQFDARSFSVAECERDFRAVFCPYGPVEVKVSIPHDARFKIKN